MCEDAELNGEPAIELVYICANAGCDKFVRFTCPFPVRSFILDEVFRKVEASLKESKIPDCGEKPNGHEVWHKAMKAQKDKRFE
jgi:hypothetical protein